MNLSFYDRNHPFLACIKDRHPLTKLSSLKDTQHVVLNLEGSNIKYQVGDSFAIYPKNDPLFVQKMLEILKVSGEESVINKKGGVYSFKDFLSSQINLKNISQKMLKELKNRLPISEKNFLEDLLKEENKDKLKLWLNERELWDLLEHFSSAKFSPQEIVDLAMPLLPRFYSIASSQMVVGEEVHLTVAYLRYETHGIMRLGVCTHYLCQLAPLNVPTVFTYVQKSADFHLPKDSSTPIIMIGPGTGVAPFRGFMQEREAQGASGKNWLFFGEWTREKEFYYQEEWERWCHLGFLNLDVAFSRDQPNKVYVQDKMLENGKKIYEWLEEGAIIYVCGDAKSMAKDVDYALHQIIQVQRKMGEEDAKGYIKNLKKEKRYLRDVY